MLSRITNSAKMSAPKACEGATVKLAPLRMAEMVKKPPAAGASALAPGAPIPSKPAAYVPPSQRKAEAAAKPTTILSSDLDSQRLFPTLGGPRPAVAAAPATPSAWGSTTQNQFTALDDDASSTTSSVAALNFKSMLHRRIEQDAERQRLGEIPETDDPLEMSNEKLTAEGWAVLNLRRSPLDRGSRFEELPDEWERYLDKNEEWTSILNAKDLMDSGDSHYVLTQLCSPAAVGENVWERYKQRPAEEKASGAKNVLSPRMRQLSEARMARLARTAAS